MLSMMHFESSFHTPSKPEPNGASNVSQSDKRDPGHGCHTLNSSQDLPNFRRLVTNNRNTCSAQGWTSSGCAREGSFPTWALFILLLLLLIGPLATTAEANPWPAPSAGTHETTVGANDISLLERASIWVLQTQRELHRRLTHLLHQLEQTPTARTAGALILASFLYGIFHAAGPGHGKAVISTYLLTHRESLPRGIGLSFMASLLQGITAILLVVVLVLIFGWLARDAMGQVRHLELASFILVGLLGLWLIGRALRGFWRQLQPPRKPRYAAVPESAEQRYSLAPVRQQPPASSSGFVSLQPVVTQGSNSQGSNPQGSNSQDIDCSCSVPHHLPPNPRGPWLTAVVAVGIRPCTGAVLVMAVSLLLGLWAAGVAAVLAMSIGTALTVSILALLAVTARNWAAGTLQASGRSLRWLPWAGPTAGLIGGVIIAWLGWTLALGTMRIEPMRHPLGL